jgi:hypothetical protein
MKNPIQRFFCFIGIHRWKISTVVDDGIVTDYHRLCSFHQLSF